MPQNFFEVWLSRVKHLLSTIHLAPFLDGIPELDTPVVEMGEENTIHIPIETFAPDVLINNSTYPLDIQEYADGTMQVNLDKYQTKATRISDDAAIGASYDKIDTATRGHVRQISRTKYKKAVHAIAPAANTPATPVLELASITPQGVYNALVDMAQKFDENEVPEDGRRAVLAPAHYNALLKDDKYFTKIVDPQSGTVSYEVAGFVIFKYAGNPYFDTDGEKLPWGTAPGATDKVASVFFQTDVIAKKTGLTKQYYDKPDTTMQAHRVNYRHYFIVLPVKNEAIGAII